MAAPPDDDDDEHDEHDAAADEGATEAEAVWSVGGSARAMPPPPKDGWRPIISISVSPSSAMQ